jgi:hypothetical protein
MIRFQGRAKKHPTLANEPTTVRPLHLNRIFARFPSDQFSNYDGFLVEFGEELHCFF